MPVETILLVFVLVAGFYMAWNIGANDVANAMGTSVGTGALTLRQAVIVAAILEFCGAFFFGSHVSETVQKGIVEPSIFLNDPHILVYGMLASLIAAGAWLQMASYFGWPVSTTHAIVGSVIGFGAVVGGWNAIYWDNVTYIVSSWVISPLMGGFLSYYTFCLLRKRIFYTFYPVRAAKRLAPILVFILLSALSLIMVFRGLCNVNLELSFTQAFGISVLIGLAGSLISFILVNRIPETTTTTMVRPVYGPEIANSLIKAKKHLKRVQNSTTGEMQYHTSVLMEEVDHLSSSLQQNIQEKVSHSEYATVEKIFSYMQIISASMMAFAHGANDVANAIGPLAAAVGVLTTGVTTLSAEIPTWILGLGGVGIIFGLATWGWRVIETIGKKITELTPTRGFAAEFGAALTILVATRLGMPISTTHTLVGSVIGVGLARGMEALNLVTIRDIIISWIITVPAGACIAVVFFYVIQAIFG